MRIVDLLKQQSIALGKAPANKQEAIDILLELQEKSGNILDIETYKKGILAREEQGSTAVGEGIAVPHAKSEAVKAPSLAAITVPAGSTVKLQAAKNGSRTYIAFCGGFDIAPIMGSRATSLQCHIGGIEGRKLKKGDVLPLRPGGVVPSDLSRRAVCHHIRRKRENIIRVLLGPQADAFTEEGLSAFLGTPYTVSKEFDRMGCRLEGQSIGHKTDGNIISDGIVNGAIQVPTTGQPIIMLAERQATGGYTKIATVISADLPVIGQCCPGDILRFQAVSIDEAHRLLKDRRSRIQDLKRYLNEPPGKHTFRVTMHGKTYEVIAEIK